MAYNNGTMNVLKMKLKSATKFKLQKEKELFKIRDTERSLYEELTVVQTENKFLKEQLEDLRTHITQAKHQISMIEICSTSEKSKIEAHIRHMENHGKGFQDIFDKEINQHELRKKQLQKKEAAEEEVLRQKEKELAERDEQEKREAAAIEAECDALEQECAVLKKRNNAIMLKLRRKLLETEKARRELMKRNSLVSDENPQ